MNWLLGFEMELVFEVDMIKRRGVGWVGMIGVVVMDLGWTGVINAAVTGN